MCIAMPCKAQGQSQCGCSEGWCDIDDVLILEDALVEREPQSFPASPRSSLSSQMSVWPSRRCITPETASIATRRSRQYMVEKVNSEAALLAFPSAIESSALNRRQLLQRFYDLHFGTSSNARQLFNYEALNTSDPDLIATTAAMDTLSIAQIATTFQDSQLMLEARIMYGKTMRYLRMKVRDIGAGRPSQDQLEDITGAIHALTPCAWFNCMQADNLEWMSHTQALLKILEVYGWESINPSTVRSFYYNWKHRAFFDSLSQRVKVKFPEPPANMHIPCNSTAFLTDYALDVPGLLWRSDKLFRASQSGTVDRSSVLLLLMQIGACTARFKRWHLEWVKSFPPRPHYRTVSTRTFKSFPSLCGDYFGLFPTAYDFSHPHHERDFRILSICLLNLDQATMNIFQAFPDFCSGDELDVQLRSAEYDAATSAADLCMLIPWATQPQNMAFASVHAQQPLFYASRYYQSQGQSLQLAWCRKVSRTLSFKYGIGIRFSE